MGPGFLKVYRWVGVGLFYATSYLMKPHRIWKSIKNIREGHHKSRLETVLDALLKRYTGRVASPS